MDLGDRTNFDEKTLEQALVTRIQKFMLELGRGFAFVGRQYRLDADTASHYVDLVFYNINLRCHVLVELKTQPLDPKDVGQMDFYVRLFDSKYAPEEDSPTIGLILCSSSGRTAAKYSAFADGKGLFASTYVTYLPTEEELTEALEPTRRAAQEAMRRKEPLEDQSHSPPSTGAAHRARRSDYA
ncbi:MAG: PDDEXK nuclease domain-containing protein [Coriobacteriales bacterium]|nr:PDDEXK nuclease domain-containing protein [Coriobacteriales bacterium]